jgi:hypothetical protein
MPRRRIRDRVGVAGHDRYPGFLRQLLGGEFVAHRGDRVERRADEDDPRRLERAREIRVLGQKAIARMDRLGAGRAAGGEDGGDLQVALRRGGRTDAHGLIGLAHMEGVGIGVAEDGNRLDAHALGGAHDAAGDLAAIGDEDFAKHRVALIEVARHSGMLSCFFHGLASSLPRSIDSERQTRCRVDRGVITSSI